MEICGVIFKESGKIYYFNKNNIDINIGDYVIVETEKGEQFGKIIFINTNKNIRAEKNILKKASNEDYNKYLKSLKEAQSVIKDAKQMAQKLDLNMQFIDASYNYDKTQLVINFIADERIDFRELVKMLAAKYKTRIDLHQIGVRDKAKEVSGIGQCGRELCCSKFLAHIDTISINMAKNQNIALNPNKINGSCGRLLCCLSYEDEVYTEYRKNLPSVGDMVKYENNSYKVISCNPLKQSYTINIDGELKEIIIENEK